MEIDLFSVHIQEEIIGFSQNGNHLLSSYVSFDGNVACMYL